MFFVFFFGGGLLTKKLYIYILALKIVLFRLLGAVSIVVRQATVEIVMIVPCFTLASTQMQTNGLHQGCSALHNVAEGL